VARKLIDIVELDKFVTSLEERESAYRANNLPKKVYSVEDQEYVEVPC
jgi:hypothetical protein